MMATAFFPPYGADHEMTHCPCGHRWLGHGVGQTTKKGGYGRCFAEGCNCAGVDAADAERMRR